MNFADRDPALYLLLDRILPPADRRLAEPVLTEIGEVAGGELDHLAAVANANPPALRRYAPDGSRIDEVEFHPAYERMCELAFRRYGLAAMSHRDGVHGWPGRVPHVVKYAVSYVFVQAEFGLACPIAVTDHTARVLTMYDSESFPAEIAALTSTDMESLATGTMWMTEKQGGTDIAQTETVATDHGSHWTLRGQKWFASNVTADVILTLARVPGQGGGTRGLGMFMVPKRRPDGSRNTYRIERLKDKLGSRSMASGEIELDDAYARPVGALTNGFLQMAEMLNVSRLSNAMRGAALMRRAVLESVDHTRTRIVFGEPLFEQPLMRATLLPMLLDTEAALGLVLECADRLESADNGDDQAKRLIRILTPLVKYIVCKQARGVTGEAMEIRGGNGYIEDWVNPRLLRDAHLGSIWEGSSNVIALDILRCMRREAAHRAVISTYTSRLRAIDTPAAAPAAGILVDRLDALLERGDGLLGLDPPEQELRVAGYAATMCRTIMASLLLEQAAYEITTGHGHRKLLLAHTYLHRLIDPDPEPQPALAAMDALSDGGHVSPDLALAAFDAIDPHRT